MRRKRIDSTPKTAAATAREARNAFKETPEVSWALPAVAPTALPTSETDDGVADTLIVSIASLAAQSRWDRFMLDSIANA
jgi:hypothetical protein